jgi:hypothetical protein
MFFSHSTPSFFQLAGRQAGRKAGSVSRDRNGRRQTPAAQFALGKTGPAPDELAEAGGGTETAAGGDLVERQARILQKRGHVLQTHPLDLVGRRTDKMPPEQVFQNPAVRIFIYLPQIEIEFILDSRKTARFCKWLTYCHI